MQSKVSYFWNEPTASTKYQTGVSIHGHTNHSRESLSFLLVLAKHHTLPRMILRSYEKHMSGVSPMKLDVIAAYWTPPLNPRLAYELEVRQIQEKLGLQPIVSLSDHDNIEAPLLLRLVPEYKDAVISTEWTVPYGELAFHLGIHNLPASAASSWMCAMQEYTAAPSPKRLSEILRELHNLDDVLIVFNHPLWNLYGADPSHFRYLVTDFLGRHSAFIHAFELNGLRTWKENQQVAELAYKWNQLVISGGDRHGCEPNANVNLTNARNFAEFVHEIRVRRVSHIMMMPQYADPFAARCFQTFLDVIRHNSEMPIGAQNWDDRTFHPDPTGTPQPISSLWSAPPKFLQMLFSTAAMFENGAAYRFWLSLGRKQITLRILGDGEIGI
ncbi:MAG TPA: hypothetical protein VMT82_04060 [candidate division Zixibacteria bacterium]|nr:hypothetical protein [candidate division Zixibacteria bacterium]